MAQTLSGRTGSGQVGKAWRALGWVQGSRVQGPSRIRTLTRPFFPFLPESHPK